ncbi:LuxR C-terminal-related transcriptional regulator [Methylobacterium marchantiae]|uniref:LuxR C-terminal-related transcriptional regulator n=2 Tax=Methylobacterium marchantiae TaxID=600331 RepID=A0ABW3WTC0_9HYPH|nr:HTH-type transcriptional regulator MalT [Methylobacterium marchantiae]
MATRNAGERGTGTLDIRAGDLAEALRKRNPTAELPHVEYMAELLAAVGAATESLEVRQRGFRAIFPADDEAIPKLGALSKRERDILHHLTVGAPNKVIASELKISEATVKIHVKHILRKLGVRNRVEASSLARTNLPISANDLRRPDVVPDPHRAEPLFESSPERYALVSKSGVEPSRGRGLGGRISSVEGARRLSDYALPLRLEDWAGPLAGPVELAADLGIARSTLQDWRRGGAVIGLLKGARKHVFPLAQFVDGRPVPGIADVLGIVGDARTAWLWLSEPRELGASLLEDLRHGRIEPVLRAARDDFA